MNRTGKLVIGAVVAAVTIGVATSALALWAANSDATADPIPVGGISFAATAGQGGAVPQYSANGGPVTLTLPGSEIAKVLDGTDPSPAPVIWRFTAEGQAEGITGLSMDVTAGSQIAPNGAITDIGSGIAARGTVLAFSTLRVYAASINGDCATLPEVPETDPGKNIYLYDSTDHVLQTAGGFAGQPVRQQWCVAITFNADPPGAYANEVQAHGIAANGDRVSAVDSWRSVVAFPPSLDASGIYRNHADVVGVAMDGTASRASDQFEARVYPDPNAEPDVTIVLDPKVTNLNPTVSAGDRFTPTP
ncbi:MAG: hypothetical protein FWD74_00090 [Actinomycetia bacterium]|nr:hypothetical protein [Actinomycetes bacterium]